MEAPHHNAVPTNESETEKADTQAVPGRGSVDLRIPVLEMCPAACSALTDEGVASDHGQSQRHGRGSFIGPSAIRS